MSDEKPTEASTSDQPESGAGAESVAAADSNVESKKSGNTDKRVVLRIRGYSKVIFFWPVVVVSLIFFLLGGGADWYDSLVDPSALAVWWIIVFALNLMVFTFDFGRTNFITTIAILAVIFLSTLALDQSMGGVFSAIYDFFGSIKMDVHPNFYLCMAIVMGFFILLAVIKSRFNYWQIGHNELVHHHGILGDVRAYSTLNMHVEKEIPDVFEFLLFGSGRLIFKPMAHASENKKPLVVENVFMINRVEKEVKNHISVLKVDSGS